MRTAAPLLLLLLAAARAAENLTETTTPRTADPDNTLKAVELANGTVLDDATNSTLDSDDEHEPIVRKKRTFGDIVFRGLADVLGYNVQRKQQQAAFPPPLAPVPGIDLPLQAAPAPPPAPAPPAAPPCGAPRAAAPPPCRAQRPPPPKPTPPPCPRPRAAPKPKPRPPPPPPPPPPCPQPRANPSTPAPCAPPPPKQQADPNLETISSRFQLSFNFERSTPAPVAQEDDNAYNQEVIAPIAIEPRAARLPPAQQRDPRVFVDAFVLRNGEKRRVNTIDAKVLDPQRAPVEDDYLGDYEDESQQIEDDDYEDVQESRDQAVKQFGKAVNKFWEKEKKKKQSNDYNQLPDNHYQKVHFGDRKLANQIRRSDGRESHQSLQRGNANTNTIHLPLPEGDDEDAEVTTTTEDPRRPLRPRVLPPTEHNPNQIDTVTVRVPPIYKEKRPKKLHRERPERPDRDENDSREAIDEEQSQGAGETDTYGEDSVQAYQTEAPIRRRRRRKQNRKTRSTEEKDESDDVDVFALTDFDYFGKKLPISKEEEYFRGLTIPPPTKDADLARIEEESSKEGNGHFLNDHERLRDDPERIDNSGRSNDSGRVDDSGRTDDTGKIESDDRPIKDESHDKYRADSSERTDKLSPNAKVHETGYSNNYVHAKNVQVDDSRPRKVV